MIKFFIRFYLTFLYIDMFTNLSLMYKYRIIEHLEKHLRIHCQKTCYLNHISERNTYLLKRLYVSYVD